MGLFPEDAERGVSARASEAAAGLRGFRGGAQGLRDRGCLSISRDGAGFLRNLAQPAARRPARPGAAEGIGRRGLRHAASGGRGLGGEVSGCGDQALSAHGGKRARSRFFEAVLLRGERFAVVRAARRSPCGRAGCRTPRGVHDAPQQAAWAQIRVLGADEGTGVLIDGAPPAPSDGSLATEESSGSPSVRDRGFESRSLRQRVCLSSAGSRCRNGSPDRDRSG